MSVDVNAKQFDRFVRDLKSAGLTSEVEMSKTMTAGLLVGGEAVEKVAKQKASFSTRIPATIKARLHGTRVEVQAGGSDAPHAGPLDHRGVAGSFKHPVFGQGSVSQRARPFFEPALVEASPATVKAVDDALEVKYRKVWH